MKGDFLMAKTKKEPAPLWAVLTQGSLLALGTYFLGLLGLSALLVRGSVGEGNSFALIAGLMILSVFLGGLATVRRTPWGAVPSGLITAVVFICALAAAGFGFWGNVAFAGSGGVLAVCALAGGMLAGLAGRRKPRKGKRVRK